MIHNIALAWPNYNLDVIFNLKEVKGDSIIFNVVIDGLDLTGYKIRAELYDLNKSIKLANTLAGGSDSQIVLLEPPSGTGKFKVIVPSGATGTCQKYGMIEIELEDTNGSLFTVLQQQITFVNERIIWDTPESA